MKTDTSHLRKLREKAGLSLRELARQIGEQPSNLTYWETSGTLPRSNVLIAMSEALGVSVEELLGKAQPKRNGKPSGRLGHVVNRISRMPRRQKERIVGIVETLVTGEEAQK